MCIPRTAIDISTQANIDQVKTTHIHLNWNVDFKQQIIYGNVVLSMVTLVNEVDKITLDTRYLDVKSVSMEEQSLKVYFMPCLLEIHYFFLDVVQRCRSICRSRFCFDYSFT